MFFNLRILCLVSFALTGHVLGDYLSETWKTRVLADTKGSLLHGRFVEVRVKDGAASVMAMYVSKPLRQQHVAPAPVVIIAHHAVGIYHHTFLRSFADDLANAGFVAVLPDFFHRVWSDRVPNGMGMPFENMSIGAMLGSLQDAQILQDLGATLSWIDQEASADAGMVGVLGFCMGGRISWLAAVEPAFQGRIHAAVPYHGGNVFKGLGRDAQAPAERISEHLTCPVLGHFGGEDKNPSPSDMQQLQALAGRKLEVKVFRGADHGFSCKDSVKYLQSAAQESWNLTLGFLTRVLSTPRGSQEL